MTIMKSLWLWLAIWILDPAASFAAGPGGNSNVPQPSKPVALERYVGRWYEVARYENGFERGCEKVTADYHKRRDGLIAVINTCHRGAEVRAVDGRGKVVPNSGNAKLRVSFFGPFFFGNYWILDHANDYSWSIVGEPSGRYLWVLTRSPKAEQSWLAQLT